MLKVTMFVTGKRTFCMQNLFFYGVTNDRKWTVYPVRKYQIRLIFTFICIELTLTPHCRSNSKLVRYSNKWVAFGLCFRSISLTFSYLYCSQNIEKYNFSFLFKYKFYCLRSVDHSKNLI